MATKHDTFYWDLVTFQVEDVLYKVPKRQFIIESGFFRDMFEHPQGDNAVEKSSDEHPICLPNSVTKHDFEVLVKALYLSRLDEDDFESLTFEDWMVCMRLSKMWDFQRIKQTATKHLTCGAAKERNATMKIILGGQYEMPELFREGFEELLEIEKLVLGNVEKEMLGQERLIAIYEIREDIGPSVRKRDEISQAATRCRHVIAMHPRYGVLMCDSCLKGIEKLTGDAVSARMPRAFMPPESLDSHTK